MSSTTRMALPATSAEAVAAARFDGVEITAMMVLAPPAGDVAVMVLSLVTLPDGEVGRCQFHFACQCSKRLPAITGSRHDIAYQACSRHAPRWAKMSMILLFFPGDGPKRTTQPSSIAVTGRSARPHQFSQARLMLYGPVRDMILSTSPALRNLMSPMAMACICSLA